MRFPRRVFCDTGGSADKITRHNTGCKWNCVYSCGGGLHARDAERKVRCPVTTVADGVTGVAKFSDSEGCSAIAEASVAGQRVA
jgi:hypothetical protein